MKREDELTGIFVGAVPRHAGLALNFQIVGAGLVPPLFGIKIFR